MKKIKTNPEVELDKQGNFSLKDSILRLIWKEHEISRVDISRKLGLSRSTVTEIIKEILETGFIREVGSGKSSGGRKPIVLQFQDDARAILGIDIGARHIAVALTNLRGKLIFWKEKKFTVREDSDGTYKLLDELCTEALDSRGIDASELLSIGVAVPSPVDPIRPDYLSETILPAWHGKSGVEKLKQQFGVQVYIDNDANLGALAEHWWGSGRNTNDLIYVKLSYGIGAGYILGGKLYRGAKGIAGEMSHMSIDPNGLQCGCGLRGCLATVASESALIQRVKTLSVLYPESPLANGEMSGRDIEIAAFDADPLAKQIVSETAVHLSNAFSSLVNLMNPEKIIIGGSLAGLDGMLLDPIRKKLDECSLVKTIKKTEVEMSNLGSRGVSIGAATLAIEQAFIDPRMLRQTVQPAVID